MIMTSRIEFAIMIVVVIVEIATASATADAATSSDRTWTDGYTNVAAGIFGGRRILTVLIERLIDSIDSISVA